MTRFRIWEEIAAVLRAELTSGQWAPDSLFPPQKELAERFNVQPSTIAKALQLLTTEGLLYAPHGLRERRVAGPRPLSDRTTDFLTDPAWRDPWVKTLSLRTEEPPASVRRYMPEPERLVHWRTLQGDGPELVAMTDGWYLPSPALWDAAMNPDRPFYPQLTALYGSLGAFEESVTARIATTEERRQFGEVGRAPLVVLDIERITRTAAGAVVEVVYLVDRANRYRLRYTIAAKSGD
ncbi:MAG: GntR family transcriptional regulator [Sulfobacillus sp.]|nr:GntR family transcriptional regulator [Sulfobacillus sp.]